MTYIDYIEIDNFKGLGEKVRVDLGNPSVLIGPNNAGKTTVLQALSLWGRAVRAWLEKKGSGHMKGKRDGVGINRLLIMDIPVKETRYFWNGTRIRTGNKPIVFSICVGIRLPGGETKPLCMEFTYHDTESLYAKPADAHYGDPRLMETARRIEFNLALSDVRTCVWCFRDNRRDTVAGWSGQRFAGTRSDSTSPAQSLLQGLGDFPRRLEAYLRNHGAYVPLSFG